MGGLAAAFLSLAGWNWKSHLTASDMTASLANYVQHQLKLFKNPFMRGCAETNPRRRTTPAHLDQRMPVGDGLPWICQHFAPVVPTKRVRIVAHPTNSDDLVMAHPVGETAQIISAVMHGDILTGKEK